MQRLLLVLLAVCTISGTSLAAKHKKIDKTFKSVENLKIDAHHGKVQVKNWDKDEIRFEIVITVDGSNEDKNETMADNINIDFTEGGQQLVAQTVLGDFFSIKKLSNSLFNKGKIKISYTVQMPASVNLEIIQKNGDVFVDDHNAKFRLDQNGGNFTANSLSGNNNLKLSNVNVKINQLANTELDAAGSEVEIENADKISGESRDSEYNIQVIDNLNIKSSRDKFDIEEIESLYGTSNFTKIEIAQLGDEVDYELKFGHINIFNINNMYSFIKLDSKYGNIGLSFMKGSNLDYEINHKSVKFDNSNDFTLKNEETADKNTYVAKGKVGSKKSISKLNIRANNCKMRLD
ncbi:hypothetical protein [Marinifilum caeruleilacunae]|uniref:Adhesin domain-containing protein n=1 Tax=Marinifilum caeruleilacunae TaxID=2499076 RepID=A0ABX1WZ84_9BACT|nr:hypothetical protein [Marinifilum caeruleilacunae]NOU61468.1 hypothetical protein [Marinifilum caeruleilacunae]